MARGLVSWVEIGLAVVAVVGPPGCAPGAWKAEALLWWDSSQTCLELADAKVLDAESLPLLGLEVPEIAVVVRDDLEAGLVEGADVLQLGGMVRQFTLGVFPAVPEGNGKKVHVQADVPVQTVRGNTEKRGVMG